eukprot:1171660-Prymnesium_polylepis.1
MLQARPLAALQASPGHACALRHTCLCPYPTHVPPRPGNPDPSAHLRPCALRAQAKNDENTGGNPTGGLLFR